MTKPNSAHVVLIVDRSGSMQSIARDMEGAIADFVAKQKDVPGECVMTAAQFDDKYDLLFAGTPLATVPAIRIEPRGSTALFDAIGRTVTSVGASLASMPEADRPSTVIVVIITDGEENASREFSRDRVAAMLKLQEETYGWTFLFLGSEASTVLSAKDLGIPMHQVVQYSKDTGGIRSMGGYVSDQIGSARIGGSKPKVVQSEYDKRRDEQR